jgi:TctA family transporter
MIGLFLGRQIDNEMYRFVALFGSDYSQVLEKPITITFIVLIVFTVGYQIFRILKDRKELGDDG